MDRDTLMGDSYGRNMRRRRGIADVRLCGAVGSSSGAVMIETTPESMGLWASVDRTQGPETVWFVDRPGFFDAIFWMGDRGGPKVKLDLPTDISIEAHRGWLVAKRRTAWTIGDKTYAPDTLLGISMPAFLGGARDFTVLFER